jgi:hypothetical protein
MMRVVWVMTQNILVLRPVGANCNFDNFHKVHFFHVCRLAIAFEFDNEQKAYAAAVAPFPGFEKTLRPEQARIC